MTQKGRAVLAGTLAVALLLLITGCQTATPNGSSLSSGAGTASGATSTTSHPTSSDPSTVRTFSTTSDAASHTMAPSHTMASSHTTASSRPSTTATVSITTSRPSTSTTSTSTTVTTAKPTKPLSAVWEEMPANTNQNLRYFGYVHSDGFGVQGSYMADIAALGNANMAVINSAWTAEEAAKDLAEAKKYGFKAIVTVHGMFRYKTFGELDSAVLIDDWQGYWDAYQATVQRYIDDGTIYAFYFDEPRWFGISCEDFLDVTLYIRQTSRIRMMACMTAMDMGWSDYGNVGPCEDKYLRYCTDVLFDDYSAWDDALRQSYLAALKAKSPENARIWGCTRAMESPDELDAYGIQRMADHIKGQYREAVGDERYVGIIAYSFANGLAEGDWGYGLRDFFDPAHPCYSETLRDLYRDIGKAIIE